MGTLKVPAARLYYEVSGAGPLLILIPGARGDGEVFRQITRPLAALYQVVNYDRRGFSRSELDGPQDYDHRLALDAEDVHRLIEHLTDQPAVVFGNSSGALVALEVITRYPEQVQMVVAHEPPAFSLLPDAAQWYTFFDGVYDTYCQSGISEAMRQFASEMFGDGDHNLLETAMRQHSNEYTLSNVEYWLEYELRQYPRTELDLAALAAHAERIVLAGGGDSRDLLPYQPNKVLAQALGSEVVDFPGGHLGFMAHPDEFAQKLIDVLME